MSAIRGRAHRQQGVATLIVVMVLFFIVSLTAAYTNRNLIFEQRTSLNHYRSTQALEAAEAGLEWAVSMLNYGRITDSCLKSINSTDTSFRQRYLNINATTGKITPVTPSAGGALTPSCVRTPAGWSCSCPTDAVPTLSAPTSPGVYPAFRVRFRPVIGVSGSLTVPRQPLVVNVDVVACTQLDTGQCLSFSGQGVQNEGRAVVSSMVGLKGNVSGMPQAALTARGTVTTTGPWSIFNTQTDTSGITVHSGSTISPGLSLFTVPGSPSSLSVVESDPALNFSAAAAASITPYSGADRMFSAVFNLRPEAFQAQQAIVDLTCPMTGCTSAVVRAAISANPLRPLWLRGDLVINSGGDIGAAAEPVTVVVEGNIVATASGVNLHGLFYSRSATLNLSGSTRINGALVAEGDLSGAGASTFVYDAGLLRFLRFNNGSFVRAPASWRDY